MTARPRPRAPRPPPTAIAAISADAVLAAAAELGLALDAGQARQLAAFAALLLRWNTVHNLTALRDPDEVLSHHLLDTLALVPALQRLAPGGAFSLLDVGSGGGLPAIPIAICFPGAEVTALDAVEKKCAFLLHARTELALPRLAVVHARVESWRGGPFDFVTARAFATLADLVRLSRHLLRPDGLWLAPKGRIPADELAALPADVQQVATVKLRVPRLDEQRHLILLAPPTRAATHPSRATAELLQGIAGPDDPDRRAQRAHLDP